MNRKIFYKLVIVFYLFLGITTFSCTKDKGSTTPQCTHSLPDTVSFSKNIIPIFQINCSISGCHSGSNPTGHLNLSASVAYPQLTQKGTGYIDTINPNYSILYAQMTSSSQPMPPSGILDICTTQLILKWIQQKAKNN